MALAEKIDYSIVICTYNPDEEIFKRCLGAVSRLSAASLVLEVIIVDNNSTLSVAGFDFVQDFIKNVAHSKLLLVKEQGLSYARIAGIEEAESEHILFFDDDNEPDSNYVQELHSVIVNYPHVAAWGPGQVDVDFSGPVRKDLESYAINIFQDRHEQEVTYSNQRNWQSCYPYGTGLYIRKDYLMDYISMVRANQFTLTGRKGGKMNSGEDTQMILFCISKGAAAGVAPGLRLKHIIATKRTGFDYLKRLTYGTSSCYSICAAEVFPEYVSSLKQRQISERRFVTKTLKRYFMLIFKKKPKYTFALISFIGSVTSDYHVLNKEVPAAVNWVVNRLRL